MDRVRFRLIELVFDPYRSRSLVFISFTFRSLAILIAACLLVDGWSALAYSAAKASVANDTGDGKTVDHAGGGHHDHIGEAGVNREVSEFKQDLAIWTFAVFVLLMVILGKFAWKPITEALERREHGIAENIAAAQRAGDDARTMLAEYETKLRGAADEVRGIMEEARRDAELTKQEIIAEAKAAAQQEHDRMLRDVHLAKNQALKELSETSANLAIDLAGKIVRTQLNKADHARLVSEALNRVTAGSPQAN